MVALLRLQVSDGLGTRKKRMNAAMVDKSMLAGMGRMDLARAAMPMAKALTTPGSNGGGSSTAPRREPEKSQRSGYQTKDGRNIEATEAQAAAYAKRRKP
jgi:hypothetical protein